MGPGFDRWERVDVMITVDTRHAYRALSVVPGESGDRDLKFASHPLRGFENGARGRFGHSGRTGHRAPGCTL